MSSHRIEVVSYAGYREEESPRSFSIDGEKIAIKRILKMWIEEGADRKRRRFFKVEGTDCCLYMLFYDEKSERWYLRK
jgi:hypothetical protein